MAVDRNYTKRDMLLQFIRGSKRYFLLGTIAALVSIVLDMVIPQIIRTTVDSVIGDKPFYFPHLPRFIAELGGREYLKNHIFYIAAAAVISPRLMLCLSI